MKNLRNSISVLFLLFFVGSFNGISQTSVKDAKDKVSQTKTAAKEVKQKSDEAATSAKELGKEDMQDYKEKMSQATSKEEREELKEEMKLQKEKLNSDSNSEVVDTREDLSTPKGALDKEINVYKEKLKTATPDQRKKLESKISEMEKQKDQAKDLSNEAKKQVDKKKAKSFSDLKGREYGQARAAEARTKIKKAQTDMENRDRRVVSGRERVAAAKLKVNTDLAEGSITKAQAEDKFAKISNAERSLNNYETNLKASRAKLADRSNTVADYIKN